MKGLRLYKSEKLCSRTAVETLFAQGKSVKAYPLRAVYVVKPASGRPSPVQFLITIPKKRFRHAVDRVLMRRRVREAFRLNRRLMLYPALMGAQVEVDVAFIYMSSDKADYRQVEEKMQSLLKHIASNAVVLDNPSAS